ncbi:MAG: substrate-binding domain-containing protein [Nevskia sp.]|nr:substrate-binding domain-containing protein [Nevskia sp.]
MKPKPVLRSWSRPGAALRRCGWLAALLAALALSACGHANRGTSIQSGNAELVILASNGLKDLEFLKGPMEAAAGRPIRFQYAGTLELVDRLRESGAVDTDFAWPASGFFVRINVPQKILAEAEIARSPVVLGLKRARAHDLGWDRQAPSWDEIAQTVRRENLSLGMTNPIASDLGLAALLAATVATTRGAALEAAGMDLAKLKSLYSGSALIGGSAGWLSDSYLRQEQRLDGMINYESHVMALNAANSLVAPLAVIGPRDGTVFADWPLMLVNPARRAEYDRVVAYLRSPQVQQQIVARSWRRPVIGGVKLPPQFAGKPPRAVTEEPRAAFVDAMLGTYQSQLRVPSHSYFVLDISGSMAEEHRMDELKSALMVLAGSDHNSLSGHYAAFQPRERTALTTFNSAVVGHLDVDFGNPAGYTQALGRFRDFVDALQPRGGTAIYDAVRATYEQALQDRKQWPDYYRSIVLMTDGQSSSGASFEAFRDWYQALPESAHDIPVFTIRFGEADAAEMNALAELTGGRVFDAKEAGLIPVFKEIRGYQ